ncbi:MAG TPA: type II toxin-antitoxin system HicB family antitoxin [Verrucomicrobiales bacterium]|jgi:predicted RNase H-like HicB family nuclease|nr:type II toxin-antitoxin system HicB family antitoxin [Verrucomicrobiales bacterium]
MKSVHKLPELTATLIPCEEGGFTAICNEVSGAISEGETKEEAIANLADAIQAILEVSNEMSARKLRAYAKHFGKNRRPIKSKVMERA